MSAAPDPPAPDDASDLALGLALLRRRLGLAARRGASALRVRTDLLAELFRQRATLAAELARARARCEGLAERVAQQSELLSRRAERPG